MIKTIYKNSSFIRRFWGKYNWIKSHIISYPKSGNGFEAISRGKMVQYNKVRPYGARKLFCYNPFINLFFNISGNAIACCRSHKNVLGTYPEQSIRDIWFGKKAEKLREHMRHNDLNMGCAYCKFQISTNRFQSLPSMHAETLINIKSTKYPRTIELELSNICNLQCVMCSGRVSSSIRKFREGLEPISMVYDDKFVEQLKEFIPHLKHMYFYGGEPFLIDIYYKIWGEVIKLNPGINLYAVTNGTVFNDKVQSILEKTKFGVTISVDSLNKELFEKIRVGAKFEVVMHNIMGFLKYCPDRVSISHTPMNINWEETPDIINFCNFNNARINLSYMEGPAHLALWSNLPEKLDEIYEFYDSVKWEKSPYKYTMQNNIAVFNEWKEQLRFFSEKNKKILQSFGNIENIYQEQFFKIKALLKELKENEIILTSVYETVEQVFYQEIFEVKKSPALVEAMRSLEKYLSDDSLMRSDFSKKTINNPEELRPYLRDMVKEDQFWARYY